VGLREANASGHDDVVDLHLLLAPEHPQRFAAASLIYRLPLYRHSTMLDAYFLVSDTSSGRIATSAGDLTFSGAGNLLGLRTTRYLRRLEGFDPRFSLAIERHDQRNQCSIGSLGEEACGSAGGDLVITPLTLEYSLVGDTHIPLTLSVALVQGLPLGGPRADRAAYEAVRPGARPEFTALRTQLSFQHRLDAAGWDAGARLAAQWSAHPLTPPMQFGAGGSHSVRGYEERELSADNGVALSLELSAPSWKPVSAAGAALRPLLFADGAALRNLDEAPCSGTRQHCSLASVGLGLRLDAPSVTAKLDIAHTLHEGGTTARGRTWAHVWLRLSY
jgi:hemolysin activation/secretion protein